MKQRLTLIIPQMIISLCFLKIFLDHIRVIVHDGIENWKISIIIFGVRSGIDVINNLMLA